MISEHSTLSPVDNAAVRLRIELIGRIQGVGFRPFAFRLARQLGLSGSVRNNGDGVAIEVEGRQSAIDVFIERLKTEAPPRALIASIVTHPMKPSYDASFDVKESASHEIKRSWISPDWAICDACREEIMDPDNRRFDYPFTNCTNCGPRFSIMTALPYDRANTTMAAFAMCEQCAAEYHDPNDRRFHAEPIACPDCGPQLSFDCGSRQPRLAGRDALGAAAEKLRNGAIIAVKGIGGYHLLADAGADDAIIRLRIFKARSEKPFALMVKDLAAANVLCRPTQKEAQLLTSPEAPIVLVERRHSLGVSKHVAPAQDRLGVMLAYTPLHCLLLAAVDRPLVATSANRPGRPIIIDDAEAAYELGEITEGFLTHDRRIARPVEDAVARVIGDDIAVLRLGRGYAPQYAVCTDEHPSALALGGHLKTTIALSVNRQWLVSAHIGDLETEEQRAAHTASADDLANLHNIAPTVIVRDTHPDYAPGPQTTKPDAEAMQAPHHLAHIYACAAEHALSPPFLGVAWDGAGYGLDGLIWGGEAFVVEQDIVTHIGQLRRFRLPGGDAASRSPGRCALGVLHEMGVDISNANALPSALAGFAPSELDVYAQMLTARINAPTSSGMGRLFDAVAALLGLRLNTSFEAQAAMALEDAAARSKAQGEYLFEWVEDDGSARLTLDWRPALAKILADVDRDANRDDIARRFHNGLAAAIADIAKRTGMYDVALGGGCFQNRILVEETVARLQLQGAKAYWPQRIPANDEGLALGQLVYASRTRGKTDNVPSRTRTN